MERDKNRGFGPMFEAIAARLRRRLSRGDGRASMAYLGRGGGSPIVQTKPAPDGLEYVPDVTPARWVQDSLRDFAMVRSLVPEGYPAYARIFHPACLNRRQPRPARWSEIAFWTGRTVHPLMQFPYIADLENYRNPSWGHAPSNGSIPKAECRALIETLREFTSTPDRCWFCLWDGYGFINPRLYDRARVKAPGRDYLLFRGPVESALTFIEGESYFWHYSPNFWWPDDRAWCVGTDIDLYDTYLAGSEQIVKAVLANPDLEALPTTADVPVHLGSDIINGPAAGPGGSGH